MPTYQYACTACHERLEAVQSFSDAPLTQCPACGGALRKVFSAVGVVFKGSGFYKTDSRNGTTSGSSDGAAASSTSTGDAAASSSSSPPSTTSTSTASSNGGGSAAPAAAASKSA